MVKQKNPKFKVTCAQNKPWNEWTAFKNIRNGLDSNLKPFFKTTLN